MDTLANFEDVLGFGCVNNEDFPGARHEGTPEDSRDHKDDTDVEDYEVRRVAREETRHNLLLEQVESEAASVED